MKIFFYYCYYRLYQWSAKRDSTLAMFLTVVWLTLTLVSNVVAVGAVITIFTGLDMSSIWFPERSNKYLGALPLIIWGLFVWAILKVLRVHEKAFSSVMVEKYKTLGCRDWWVITYYAASYLVMAILLWVSGKQLGLHS